MFKSILLLAIAFASANAFWIPCNSGAPPNTITSPSCSGDACTLTRGTTLTGTINFTPYNSYPELTFYAFLYHLGTWQEIEISEANRDQCQTITCPLTGGQAVDWNINFPIPTTLPALTGAQFSIELWYGISPAFCVYINGNVI